MSYLQEKLTMAAKHQSEGRLPQAQRLYAEVLEEEPDNPDALHMLGVLLLQLGKAEQALELVGRAGTLKPGDAAILNSLGMVYRHNERLDEAEVCYGRALVLNPEDPAAHVNMGELLVLKGDLTRAAEAFRRALELDPRHAQALYNQGNLQFQRGELDAALESYGAAEEASPEDWQIKSNLGLLHKALGHIAEAEQSLRRALLLDPGNPLLSINLASALIERGDPKEAEKLCREAAILAPQNPLAHSGLAEARLALGRQPEAVLALIKSLSLNKDNPAVHARLGDAMGLEGKSDKALECYGRALALEPDLPRVRSRRAAALLLLGRYEEGFAELPARRDLLGMRASLPRIPAPRWDGSDLTGKILLLHGDSTLAETLVLLRYLPRLRREGARVVLACPPALERLVQASDLADELLLPGDPAPTCDLHAALDDLPRLLGGDPSAAPFPPYLAPDPELAGRWNEYLAGEERFNVGFLWKGEGNPGDPHDSVPLALWDEAWSLPGARWASLQYGLTEAELKSVTAEPRIADLAAQPQDLADALCCVQALDLVITPNTAVAHLAGAAGVEAWVLLPDGPSWCWGLEGETTPWYPSLRLFRRTSYGEWEPTMERVVEALKNR